MKEAEEKQKKEEEKRKKEAKEKRQKVAEEISGCTDPTQATANLVRHVADAGLAADACNKIMKIAEKMLMRSRRSELERNALGAAGAVEAVVAAMHAHLRDKDLQVWACGALWRMVDGHSTNKAAANAAGAVEAVVAAMRAHGDRGVQNFGNDALKSLQQQQSQPASLQQQQDQFIDQLVAM